jgi:hypothetical protein
MLSSYLDSNLLTCAICTNDPDHIIIENLGYTNLILTSIQQVDDKLHLVIRNVDQVQRTIINPDHMDDTDNNKNRKQNTG